MAVTKATYTANATWTAAALAGIFESAFIDAGLMTAWYDSFSSSGIENRILEVVYNAGKTYGTTYYWFMFTTSNVYLHTAGSWDAANNVPSGTVYLDYYSTTTSSTSNHTALLDSSLSAATQATLTRYTSAINTGCSWFVLRNGTNSVCFQVPSPTYGPAAFIDLNFYRYNHVSVAGRSSTSSTPGNTLEFEHRSGHLRSTFLGSSYLRGFTSGTGYKLIHTLTRFGLTSNLSGSTNNYPTNYTDPAFLIPVAMANTNTALSADHTPVFTGPPVNPYTGNQPDDFAITAQYDITSAAVGDTYIVSSGTEEYEIMYALSQSSDGYAQIYFMARTV